MAVVGCGGSGTQRAHSLLTVSPPSIDFGTVDGGTTVSAKLTLANTGGAPITFTAFTLSGDARHAFTVGATPATLDAAATANVSIQYAAPATPGADNANLAIDSDADNASEILVSLAARSTPACNVETDAAFCARLSKNCGSVTGTDNCGNARTVASCGNCAAPQTCGGADAGNVCGCTPETDALFCNAAGAQCGNLSGADNCGLQRSGVYCGGCTGAGQSCGAGDAGINRCGCAPEADSAFCAANNAACGSLTAADNCGTSRTVTSCGTCTGTGQSCGGGGSANQCGCAPESDTAFCTANNANCGSLTAADNCGTSRTVTSCGTCTGTGQSCGGGGTANQCGCTAESDAAFCSAAGAVCGSLTGADNCGTQRAVTSCGTCPPSQQCGAGGAGANHCGAVACGTPLYPDAGHLAPVALQPPAITHTAYFSGGGGGINDLGQIVGATATPGGAVPLYWPSPTSAPVVLSTANDAGTVLNGIEGANAINSAGQIVGVAGAGFSDFPLYWSSPSANPVSFAPMPGTQPIGINSAGQVVGSPTGDPYALYWSSPGGTASALPSGSYGSPISAAGINDCGQIVGYGTTGGSTVPIFWSSSSANPAPLPMGGFSPRFAAVTINNGGQIVGYDAAYAHALFWSSPTATPVPLPMTGLDPTRGVSADGLDSAGDVVGWGFPADGGPQQAVYWGCGNAIGGTVMGLAGTGLVLANSIGGGAPEMLPVSSNGTFVFPTKAKCGSSWAVTVATQPTGPAQTCTVSQGSGTSTQDVATVQVSCPIFSLATGLDGPNTVAVNGSTVYFGVGLYPSVANCYTAQPGAGDRVMMVPTAGGTPTLIDYLDNSAGNCGLYGFGFDATYAYWTNYSTGNIKKTPLATVGPSLVANVGVYNNALVLGGGNLYYHDYPNSYLSRISTAGTGATDFVSAASINGQNMTTDSSYLYWTDYTAGTVNKVAYTASPLPASPTVLVSGETSPQAPFVTAMTVYWIQPGATGALRYASLASPSAATLNTTPLVNPGSVVVDSSYAWVLALGPVSGTGTYPNGLVYKIPLAGGAPVVVAQGLFQPNSIAMDAAHLYWANSNTTQSGGTRNSDGTIQTIAK